MTFDSLGLDSRILSALKKQGYKTPTPIQAQSIPLVEEHPFTASASEEWSDPENRKPKKPGQRPPRTHGPKANEGRNIHRRPKKKKIKKAPQSEAFLLKFNSLRTNQVDAQVYIKRIGQVIHLSIWIVT